jgi:hypothetical protein
MVRKSGKPDLRWRGSEAPCHATNNPAAEIGSTSFASFLLDETLKFSPCWAKLAATQM